MSAANLLNVAVTLALPALWAAAVVVFVRHLKNESGLDRSFQVLLGALALDAGRSFLETLLNVPLQFGDLGIVSADTVAALRRPALAVWPQLANLLAGCVVLIVLARVWLPNEVLHRKKLTRQAWEAGLRLRRLIHHAPDAMFVYEADGRLVDVNEAACRSLGYSRDELLRMSMDAIVADTEAGPADEVTARLGEGEILRFAGRHRRKDGTTFPVEIAVAASEADNSPMVVTAVCRDMSGHRPEPAVHLERAAHGLAEAVTAAKNHFVESASYKLRTPLNTILGLSEMIVAGVCGSSANAKIDEYLADIHASSLELLNVVDELSGMATVEAAMSADQHSYRTIIEMSPDTICLCRKGEISFINPAGTRLLGAYEAGQVEGQAFVNFVHPDYQVLCEDNFAPLLGETAATPMKLLHPSGKVFDVLISASSAATEDGTVLVVLRNISDLTRATRDVAAQIKRLNSILDTAVDAIIVTDQTGRIETFNRSAEAMFGYSAQEAIGQSIEMLMTRVDAAQHMHNLERFLESPKAKVIGGGREITARRRDGTIFPAEIALSTCHLDDRRLFTAILRDVTERRNFEDYLAHSATHDSLTGLPNRRLLQDRLQQAVDRASTDGTSVAVWFVDLDGFKMVNDVMGHAAGDDLLIEAGQRMVSCVKPSDTVARFGGDEFTMIITGVQKKAQVVQSVEHFLDALSRPFMLRGREVTLTANIGISLYPEHSTSASDLLLHASAAMMFAKATGRNLFRFFDPVMHRQSAERLTLENELRRGIERDELLLHYQPQVEVKTGRIVGVEALVRWNHPSLGLIPPVRFIPIAEQTGLIVPLGEWVLRQACRDIRRLSDSGIDDVAIGVNISAKQFSDADMLSVIQNIIVETGIDPKRLDVEITESTLMNDPEHVLGHLERMKGLGLQLSIDDFGTGYSSLNYLKRFPVDTLKIDRSFVVDIADNPKDEAIAVTIITLAHSMGMRALAEGVEYIRQVEILRHHGCDIIQGFLYSKPMALEAVIEHLEENKARSVKVM